MASNRTFSEIVATMIDRLKLTQPNLDTKPGSVARDLFVDLSADQLSRLYTSLSLVSQKQSLATTAGRDLDLLAANFGVARGTGTAASGIVIFTTNSLTSDVSIPSGTTVAARNGIKFKTIGNFTMTPAEKNTFAANANRMRRALNIAGLNSSYALEIPVQATRSGTTGNVASLQIISADASGVSVTNLVGMSGGSNRETDDSFRSRILAVFSGANVGTSAGYRNVLLGVEGVVDALVVEPGNTLMLRDGTETLETDDGSFRILNSGTGGKVDVYILGRKIEQVSESFIFTDLSGTGNLIDERNDYILGQTGQDPTRTSEERRVLSFKNGILPAQPVDSMVSVSGTASGILIEAYTDENGVVIGNYELEKDLNPETGGSPFGFDKIHFVSNTKAVDSESVIKAELNSIDALSFSEVDEISQVYKDISEIGENSTISIAGNNYIQLNHTPVVKVSRVQNTTTGEIYIVASQNIDSSGVNSTGLIEISGRALPTASDILSVNYTWRRIFDPYIDYGGSESLSQFRDESVVDAIDWTSSGGILEEEATILQDSATSEFSVELENKISKVISVYQKTEASATVDTIATSDNTTAVGIELASEDDEVENVISIRRDSDNLELYITKENDGSFSSRTILFPSDSPVAIDDVVTVHYNKVEFFDINKTDGSSYNNVVAFPSESILEAEELFESVEDLYFATESVYVKYVADITIIHPNIALASLPITGGPSTNSLLGFGASNLSGTNQPIFFNFDDAGDIESILRFAPTELSVTTSGVSSAGKIKITGTTINRVILEVTAGTTMTGTNFDIGSDLETELDLSEIPTNIGIARVDKVCILDSYGDVSDEYDLLGYSLNNIDYDVGSAELDSDLNNYEFTLPSTENNSAISVSSGDTVQLHLLVYNEDGFEELYYSNSGSRATENRFGRIDRISVTSGFRSSTGNLIGMVEVRPANQPGTGETYFVDYEFLSPKEGERITVSYNVNGLIINATTEIESVRPVTADVLIKEAEEITVDVTGTLLINDDALNEAGTIVQNVSNAVTSRLSSTKLGSVIDYSDIISSAAAITGVDSVNISLFNETGKTGRKAFIKALDNQTISPGAVTFETISRNKFRIS
jgi:uncharacterized phage protein gp47/JayE